VLTLLLFTFALIGISMMLTPEGVNTLDLKLLIDLLQQALSDDHS
jgi:hypothetical protein